eukprot:CAMPEP_0176484630 /NCGR_PEP_ID=MMETSP0200_2-20121128/4560_1 /TAXON_ID=947934 /ORGANISM="Chaetoceros sp., Strain GSL56" /LENGTH=472 /DNA_ID=CAMNT_0017881123 /DNA_START=218 /DNA_END=1637 /DNA_ORIENTATION=-
MSSQKTKSSGRAPAPKGDREPGLTPPIPFVPPKVDDEDKPPTVEITILKDPSKKATKDNTEKKEFPAIETFTGSGATTVLVLKRMQTEVFEHLGIANDFAKVEERLDYLLQITTGRARDQLVSIFKQGRQQFADAFAVHASTKRAFERDKKVFFEWLLNGDKGKRDEIPEDTLVQIGDTVREQCQSYETYVWFEMGKLMWTRHRTVLDEHIRYLENKIIKPYDMAIRDFYDRVIEMYSYTYYIQPPSMNNQAWYEAKWSACSTIFSDRRMRTAIRNGLPRSMQDKLDQKDEDYRMVSTETFLDYLYRLETEDKQERAEKQRLKESLEKKGNHKAAEAVDPGLEKKGNHKAAEAVESGRIPKKDKKRKSDASSASSNNQQRKHSKKAKTEKYCTLCAANGAEERFIHSHNAEDCGFKERYAAKLSSGKHAKKDSKARGSSRSVNMLKKEKKKLKKVMRDDSLTAEQKQRRIKP